MRDIASPESEAEAADVRTVLDELGAGEEAGQPVIEVWNKIDLLPAEARDFLAAPRRARRTAAAVAVSAVTGEGIERLTARLAALVDEGPLVDASRSTPATARGWPGSTATAAWSAARPRTARRGDRHGAAGRFGARPLRAAAPQRADGGRRGVGALVEGVGDLVGGPSFAVRRPT